MATGTIGTRDAESDLDETAAPEPLQLVALAPALPYAFESLREHADELSSTQQLVGVLVASHDVAGLARQGADERGTPHEVGTDAADESFVPDAPLPTAYCIITASSGMVPEWFETRSAGPVAGMRSMPNVRTRK